MKILVVSGFLGAGKTTFIEALSRKSKREFSVMENEYGEEGIDGSFLERDRLKVWELTEGCICCSLKSDFASSILTIANTLNPEYLLVEPTGVGLLSSVLRNIAKIEYERISLLEPVTVVDINCVDSYLRSFSEIYSDQIKNARNIVLSKCEEADESLVDDAVSKLRLINTEAHIVRTPYDSIPPEWWENILQEPLHASFRTPLFSKKIAEPDIESLSFSGIRFDSIESLSQILSVLLEGRFGKVVRAKGFVPINGQWAKFDIAGERYKIEDCPPMKTAKAVVIGSALEKSALEKLFGCA